MRTKKGARETDTHLQDVAFNLQMYTSACSRMPRHQSKTKEFQMQMNNEITLMMSK